MRPRRTLGHLGDEGTLEERPHGGEAQQALERRRVFDPDGAPLNRLLARAYTALALPAQAAEALARAEATAARHSAA